MVSQRPAARWAKVLIFAMLVCASAAAAGRTVSLVPEDRANWTPGNLFSWVRAGHNYGERYINVETAPSDATLDLFYVRSNFQKRYEQAEAPARVILPNRAHAGPRDAVIIRAFHEGYQQKEVKVKVQGDQDRVLIELDPLPNTLVASSQVYLAGRASMIFMTREALTVRVQDVSDGFNIILAETAKGDAVDASLSGVASPLISGVETMQLGEDLMIRVSMPEGMKSQYELRSRQTRDELRDLFVYSVELVPNDGGVEAVQRARQALKEVDASDVTGCAAVWDRTLRERLDPAATNRALSPRGAFTDPYLRAAMKRLGEVSPGQQIVMTDGSKLNPASTLELAAAMSQPADAEGFMAMLRAFVSRIETGDHRSETLRGLIAPEASVTDFGMVVDMANAEEARCRGGVAKAD
jgi:hypothetical protein